MTRVYTGDQAARLFGLLAYAEENHLFLLDDPALGFGFVCDPLVGSDERVATRINVVLNQDWPNGTLLQFALWTNHDIEAHMAGYRVHRASQTKVLFQNVTQRRVEFMQDGTESAIEPTSLTKVRDIQSIITCKVPTAGPEPSEKEIERAAMLRTSFQQALSTVGFASRPLTSDLLLHELGTIVNHGTQASWRRGVVRHDPDKLLRDQILDFDNAIDVDDKGLWLRSGNKRVKVLSPKKLPGKVYFGHAASFLGDMWYGVRGIRESCLFVATLHFPDHESTKGTLTTKRQWAVRQAFGPMLKWVPQLEAKKQAYDVLFQALEDGDRAVRLNFSVILFADNEEASVAAVSNATTYFSELGFRLLEDRFFTLPLFLNALPLCADRNAIGDTFRYKTMATRHAIPLLPIFGDWKGTGTPMLQFISRNGQVMNVSLYDSNSNYNCCIAAQSGSGKSFLTNEIISAYLSAGGRVWVIDVGRSYEKLCRVYGGDFIHFGDSSNVSLNPFPLIREYDGEEGEEDMIVGLQQAMAAPTQPLTDFQTSALKSISRAVWEQKGREMIVDDVATACSQHADRRVQDIGAQLYAFTRKGGYGRYVSGDNNIKFTNDFTVLELEELKGRKHLQQVVLLQLIYQIQQEMYLGERNRPKIVIIDEAWDLLTQGDVAKFIEHGYRRFRKYFGSAITITQSVRDLYDTPTGRAIVENSAFMWLLGQKAETVNGLKKDGRLPLSDGEYELLKTVRTEPGVFSEIFFITPTGRSIGRLIVEPFRRLLYSTKADEVEAIEAHRRQGKTVAEAIDAILLERQRGIQRAA